MPKVLMLATLAVGASALALSAAPRHVAVPQRMARVALPTVARPAAARAMPAVMMADAAGDPGAKQADPIFETLKTTSFFALWYLFNIGYNIFNKKALNALPIPWTMALLQLFVGIPYVSVLWATGLRKAPKCDADNIKTLVPVSLGHLGTHIGAVISLGAGAVSFTHIVKASEPVVSAALSFLILGAVSSWQTYLTLLPIVGGVALASLKELSFTWVGFIAAMGSNLSSALRGILAKKTMSGGVGENMTEANIYAVLTILAFMFLLPVSLLVEPPSTIYAAWSSATGAGLTPGYLTKMSLLAGAFYYLYNEVAFLALGRVNPVTHAVGNTIKRVVIIIASVIAFKTPISTLGIVGSTIAIVGTLLYSLAKTKFG
jgi:solute carrier family 35 protein E1